MNKQNQDSRIDRAHADDFLDAVMLEQNLPGNELMQADGDYPSVQADFEPSIDPIEPTIDVYEVEQKTGGFDYAVYRHEQREDVLEAVWSALDDLKDGETLTITYRKYTQTQMDDVYEDD
jgi:hypothetical protein